MRYNINEILTIQLVTNNEERLGFCEQEKNGRGRRNDGKEYIGAPISTKINFMSIH